MNPVVRIVVRLVALIAVLAIGMVSVQAAQASGTPDLQLGSSSASPLYGNDAAFSATASLSTGQPKGYNLSFRVVLPKGISYAGGGSADGAAVAPRVITDTLTGITTLIFSNVSDVVANSSSTVSFQVHHDPAIFEVGDDYKITTEAFVNSNPRYIPKFDAAGVSISGATSYTGNNTSDATATIRAVEIMKSEPSREGEILRGVHQSQTVYTLTIRNNSINPTNSTVTDDYVPAGLEFLGCDTNTDNTTNSPSTVTNQEYAGSGPITVDPVTNCYAPTLVETVTIDPDGPGPLLSGVYTHVQWNTGNLAPGQVLIYKYRAAVPLRENTLDWTGTVPTPASGKQAVNLDNNSGPEVRDEQVLTNYAVIGGKYAGRNGIKDVSSGSSLTRTAEDLVVYKSASTGTLSQGGDTVWELRFKTSEYRYSDNIVVTDTLPSGYCPIGPVNYTTGNDPTDSECAPTGDNPSSPYSNVTENADGTFTIVWNKNDFAKLGHTNIKDEFVITYPTKTRASYQKNFLPTTPIVAKDSTSNKVDLTGESSSRCTSPGTPDCSTPGPIIWSDEGQPEPVVDASAAGQEAPSVVLKKEVAESGTNCLTANYVTTIPQYHPGDKVCWRLTIDFPAKVDTKQMKVTDFLPLNTTYVPGSAQDTANNTTTNMLDDSLASSGNIFWDINGTYVPLGSKKFQVVIATTIDPPGMIDNSDIKGNLMKFAIGNTPGITYPLRDQVNFESIAKRVTIKKGVRQVNSGVIHNPAVDSLTVKGGDSVTYQIDVKAIGDDKNVQVWDRVPTEYDCADITAITDGGVCVDGGVNRDVIKWTIPSINDGVTKALNYTVAIPAIVGADNEFDNLAGVRQYESTTNTGGTFTYVPDHNIDGNQPLTPNVTQVEDPSNVVTAAPTLVKSRNTSIGEPGNDINTQATIGELINYTVTTTLPAGTTFKTNPRITDTPNSAATQPIVGTPTATLNGSPLPGGWSISTVGNLVTVQLPDNTTIPTSGNWTVVMNITTRVIDVAANLRGQNRTNQANMSWTDGTARSKNSNSVSTQIVEPVLSQTKINNAGSVAQPGDIFTYTLKTSNSNSTSASIAHETIIKDIVPVGVTLLDAGNNPLINGAVVPGTGGATWNSGTRTITGTSTDINRGATVTWTYKASIDSPATAAAMFVNNAAATTTSIGGTDVNERTATSPSNVGYTASSSSTVTVSGATVTKSVDPASVTIGTPVTYTALLTIPKNLTMYDLTAFDTLPDSLDFDGYVSSSCISGCDVNPTPTVQNYNAAVGSSTTIIGWDLGNITPGTTNRIIKFTYKAHVRDTHRGTVNKVLAGQNVINKVQAESNLSDKFTFNPASLPASSTFDYKSPEATTTTPVVEPSINIDKKVKINSGAFVDGPVQSQPGDSFTYSVAVKNNGTSPAYDVTVTDQPDPDITNVVLVNGAGFNIDPWTAGDPDMIWQIPGPIAPGATVTLTYTANAVPSAQLNATDKAINTAGSHYWAIPLVDRSNPWYYRDYNSNNDTVEVAFEFPELTVNKTTTAAGFPDIANAPVEQPFGWRIVVKNNATTAKALSSVVKDTLPPAWTYNAGSTSITGATTAEPSVVTNPAGDVLTWDFNGQTIQPGASVVITFTATPQLPARLNPPVQTNDAVATTRDTSGSDRNEDGPYTDEDDAKATLTFPKTDLDIDKSAPTEVGPHDQFDYTIKVHNKGPDPATQVVINDPLPAGLNFISSADCTSAIFCNIGNLAVGASKTVVIRVQATYLVAGTIVDNTAVVSGHEFEPTPADNTDTVHTRVLGEPDVKITKTAAPTNARPGQVVTYTLKAENVGTAIANNVNISDSLPVGLTFVSADSPCTYSTGTVNCNIGSLIPGQVKTYTVKATVDQWGTADPTADHLLDIQKTETQIDLEAGQTRTVQAVCPTGYFVSDGSVRIDHIDQGTGAWTSPQVLESRASSDNTWQGTVKNTATGRAQAKIFAVCIKRTTADGNHVHNLIISSPLTVSSAALAAGKKTATLMCGPGQTAIAPGFQSSAPGDLVYSEPEGNGWKFILDLSAPSNVTFSITCLTRQVSVTNGHTHDLKFEHIKTEVTIQPGTVNETQLTCADGSKGIVADMDLDDGLKSLGNDPRPVTRAFKLYNPTDHPLKARLSLLCLGLRTGGEHVPPRILTNTAYISTTSAEIITGNNSSSATVTAEDTDNYDPIVPVDPVKPIPSNPIAGKIAGSSSIYRAGSVAVKVNCSGACAGVGTLSTASKVKVGGKTYKKGTVLAKGKFSLSGASTSTVKLKATGPGKKLFKGKKKNRGLLTLTGGDRRLITIR